MALLEEPKCLHRRWREGTCFTGDGPESSGEYHAYFEHTWIGKVSHCMIGCV